MVPDLDGVQMTKELPGSFSNIAPLSMKSMTVNELLFKLLQLPPSWPDVCRLESSFDRTEPSPSLLRFDLLLFFFEDIFTVKHGPRENLKRVNRERHHSLPGESLAPPPFTVILSVLWQAEVMFVFPVLSRIYGVCLN